MNRRREEGHFKLEGHYFKVDDDDERGAVSYDDALTLSYDKQNYVQKVFNMR